MALSIGPWMLLAFAICLEVIGTALLTLSQGFTRWHWGVFALVFYLFSLVLMASTLKHIPVGVVYAVWAGVGIVAISAVGHIVFGQHLDPLQYFFILLIVAGAVGLRLTTPG